MDNFTRENKFFATIWKWLKENQTGRKGIKKQIMSLFLLLFFFIFPWHKIYPSARCVKEEKSFSKVVDIFWKSITILEQSLFY